MNSELESQFDKALSFYTSEDHYDYLLKAKDEYFSLTGSLNEDDDEYETKMNCFNDWYLSLFKPRGKELTLWQEYAKEKELSDNLFETFSRPNYSLFEFLKFNFKKQVVIKDILHGKKLTLPKDHRPVGLIPGDLFVGRTLEFNGEPYLMHGLCLFPSDVKSVLTKEAKKIRKLSDLKEEEGFLLSLEKLKTKWKSYGHIDINKIFVFNAS